MATITPVDPTLATSTTVTYTAAAGGGDTIATGLRPTRFLVRNASGGSITVTLTGVITCSQNAVHNLVVTAPVGDTEIPVPYNVVNAATGNVAVGYSAVTSITVAATF